jgi:hypothetical protein
MYSNIPEEIDFKHINYFDDIICYYTFYGIYK